MTILYAKLTDGQLATTCVDEENTDLTALILADGFKPYDDTAPKPAVGEFGAAVAAYTEYAEGIRLRWDIIELSPEKLAAEIARLESALAATDYQVIKSYEYTLAGQPSPYDISALHTERQALRDRIRELEIYLNN
jgi:hypothetical protein